jgi:hypothetical protein
MHDHLLLSCNKNNNSKKSVPLQIYSSSIHDDPYMSFHLLKFVCYSLTIQACILNACLEFFNLFLLDSTVPASVVNRSLLEPHFYCFRLPCGPLQFPLLYCPFRFNWTNYICLERRISMTS